MSDGMIQIIAKQVTYQGQNYAGQITTASGSVFFLTALQMGVINKHLNTTRSNVGVDAGLTMTAVRDILDMDSSTRNSAIIERVSRNTAANDIAAQIADKEKSASVQQQQAPAQMAAADRTGGTESIPTIGQTDVDFGEKLQSAQQQGLGFVPVRLTEAAAKVVDPN